jgi:septum formation topological specificity factor MinE
MIKTAFSLMLCQNINEIIPRVVAVSPDMLDIQATRQAAFETLENGSEVEKRLI